MRRRTAYKVARAFAAGDFRHYGPTSGRALRLLRREAIRGHKRAELLYVAAIRASAHAPQAKRTT